MKKAKSIPFEPYCLSIQGASDYFGIPRKDFYKLISNGSLRKGIHYHGLKMKPLIIRRAFAKFLEEDRPKGKGFSIPAAAEALGVDEDTVEYWLSPMKFERARIPKDGWFSLDGQIRIKEWAIEGLKTGESRCRKGLGWEKESDEDESEVDMDPHPYSLNLSGASAYFGLAVKTLRNWIDMGRLHRGIHHINIGRKPLIIHDAFIEFLKNEDSGLDSPAVSHQVRTERHNRPRSRRMFE